MKSKTFHAICAVVLLAVGVHAMPFNTDVILDGRPTEYTTYDLHGVYAGDHLWEGNAITNLYITWDETYLYLALQGWQTNNNKLVVMLDVDPGNGTGATTTTNWVNEPPDYIQWNCVGWQAADGGEQFGLDFMVASEGFYNNIVQVLYDGIETPDTNNVVALFDHGNGNTPVTTPVDMAVQADDTDCDLKGFEARIPWTVLYPQDGRHGHVGDNIVPTGAIIRVFANIHNNNPALSYSSPSVIPDQSGSGLSDYDDGLLTTDVYIDVEIDSALDGMPDNFSMGVNPPYLRAVMGKEGADIVYARFNKPFTVATATNTANWMVNGANPFYVTNIAPDSLLLYLNDPLPNNMVEVRADGVEDASALSRETYLCLFPSDTGLDEPLTVRFVLDTNSGMGPDAAPLAHGASSYFINGDAPFEWGYPPSMSTPITNVLSGSLRYRDVVFPPGTPLTVNYKFSALLTGTGTNNYEAVRLADYLSAARVLTLNTNAPGGVMYVTNRLGAAAGPLRGVDVPGAYTNLYFDARRGDSGVSTRKSITFQLDLSAYGDLSGAQRIMIQGSDPLRGFNYNGTVSDWLAGGNPMQAGLPLQHVGGGVYELKWALTENGKATDLIPGTPNSLVAGSFFDGSPLVGWADRRTPRSMKYQFYIINEWGNLLTSPGFDIELFVEPGGSTNIVLEPHVWTGPAPDVPLSGDDLPDTTNAPTTVAVSHDAGNVIVNYVNDPDQWLHVVDVTDDLLTGWKYYGQELPFASAGAAEVDMMDDEHLFVRIRGARGLPYRGIKWEPNPVPDTGAVVRVYFRQHQSVLAGFRNVQIAGSFTGWGTVPMAFAGNGVWYYDVIVDEADGNHYFKIRDGNGLWHAAWGVPPDGNYPIYKGDHHATWSPGVAVGGNSFTITYDAAGGPLAAAPNIFAYQGFDEGWGDAGPRPMTNTVGTIWEVAFTVPTNYYTSVNFVFNNGAGTWHSENDGGGRAWRAFIAPIDE